MPVKTASPRAVLRQRTPGTLSPASLKRRQQATGLKRSVILRAGLEVFSRVGYAGASVEQVAEIAGVSKTNLIYYFKSKEELYFGVLDEVLSLWLAPMQEFSPDNDPAAAFRAYIVRKIDFSRDHPQASRLFCMEVLQGGGAIHGRLQKALKPTMDGNAQIIRHWIATGRINPVEPYHLLYSIWAMTQHYADFSAQIRAVSGRNLRQKAFRDEAVAHVCQMVLGGLGIGSAAPG